MKKVRRLHVALIYNAMAPDGPESAAREIALFFPGLA